MVFIYFGKITSVIVDYKRKREIWSLQRYRGHCIEARLEWQQWGETGEWVAGVKSHRNEPGGPAQW